MSDKYQTMDNENSKDQNTSYESADSGIELRKTDENLKLTKKGKPRKPYIMTPARIASFARCRAKKDEYMAKIREKKKAGEIIKEPVARTLNKYVQLKNKLKAQGVEVDDIAPIKVKVREPVVVDEHQNSSDDEIVIKKKPKEKPKKKRVVVFQSDSEEDNRHYNTSESSSEEEVVVKPKKRDKKHKQEQPQMYQEKKQFTLQFV